MDSWKPILGSLVPFGPARAPLRIPPQAFDEAPIAIDDASRLMAELGFIAFRTPLGAVMPDSCLMAMLQDSPTGRHFDPELASYWVIDNGSGRINIIERDTPTPLAAPFSWGPIRLIDRFGARNSFVSFGGTLQGAPVGPSALLLIFRSSAPILRLPGHSQQPDRMSDEILTFFGRLVPKLWDEPALERLVGGTAPEELYAAFLLHTQERLRQSTTLRDSIAEDVLALERELSAMALHRPNAVAASRCLLERLNLAAIHD
jgi:hypothetical protein